MPESFNYINYRYYAVRYDEKKHGFAVFHETFGKILEEVSLTVHIKDLNHVYSKVTLEDFSQALCTHEKHLDGNCLSVNFIGGPSQLAFLRIQVELNNQHIYFHIDANEDTDYIYELSGRALWGDSPLTDTFSMASKKHSKGLRSAYGPASSPINDVLFNRKNDTMLRFFGMDSPHITYDWKSGNYCFLVRQCGTMLTGFGLKVEKDIYADTFALHYKCITKTHQFPSPPVGFMTWYAVMWNAGEKSVLDNAAIQAEKLKPYGANVIWVDWEWYHNDCGNGDERCDTFTPDPQKYPHGLKYVADKIAELGFVPAIWIGATNDVKVNSFFENNQDMLLLEKPSWCGIYFFDPTQPKYLKEFIPKVFGQLMDWGYEAFKWDALPLSLDYYDQYHDRLYDSSLTSEQALRGAVKAARTVIGENRYMLSCHGEASRDITFAADIFDAARIGADIFHWEDFKKSCVERIFKFYPLHNVIQYCDPDNVVIREEFNNDRQAISRVSFVSLLGTPITLGDDLTKLPDSRIEMIRRTIPALDIHPMDIENGAPQQDYTIVNLFVCQPFEEYQVVNIFNLTERPLTISVKMEELELEAEEAYLLFDYWASQFTGCVRHDFTVHLAPCESKVFAVRKIFNRPQLLSTSRHITQGACELRNLQWDEHSLSLSGVSETIIGDEYTLFFYVPDEYRVKGERLREVSDNVFSLQLDTTQGGNTAWNISFERQ